MPKHRKGRNNYNNKSNDKPFGASTKAQDRRNWNKGCSVYVGYDSLQIYQPLLDLDASPNSQQNVTEKKGVNKNDGKSEVVIDATMQSDKEVTANESEVITSKDIDNSTLDNHASEQGAGKSKKKRRRRRKKSTLDTPGSESLPSAEREPDSSNRVIEKDTDGKSGCKNKAPDHSKQIAQRISQIESQQTKPKSDTYEKHMMAGNKSCSPSEKKNRKMILCTAEEKALLFPFDDNNVVDISEDSYTSSFTKPVIFMLDKTTQTDQAPEPSNISISTDGRSSNTLHSDSHGSVVAKPTESSLLIPVSETNPANVSAYTDTFQNNISSCSSLSSHEENLRTITKDFLRNVKIASANFKDGIIKCWEFDK